MQQQLQPQALPNNSESLEAPLSPPPNAVPSNSSHLADEDGGGPSTSASSAKKRKPRSSSWSPAKKKHSKGKEKEFLIAPPLLGSAPLPAISAQGGTQLAVAGGNTGMVSHSKPVGLLSVQSSSKQDKDGGRTLTNGSGVVEDEFGPVNTASMNLSGKQKKTGKKERERERVKRDLLIGKSVEMVEEVGKLAASRGHAVDEKLEYEDDHVHERDDEDEDEDDEDDAGSLDDLSILQPPPRRKKGKDVAHIHNMAGIAGGGAYKSTPGSPKRRREFDDIHVDQDGGGGHGPGRESLGDEEVEDNAGGGGVPDIAPDGSIDRKQIPTKRVKGLTRVRSVPELGEEEPTLRAPEATVTVSPGKSKFKNPKTKPAASSSSSSSAPATTLNSSGGVDVDQPRTKRNRLIVLAKKLRQFFPDQRQELRRVTVQLERQAMGKGKKRTFLTSGSGGSGGSAQLAPKSMPISVPSVRKSRRTLHHRTGSESTVVDMDDHHLIEGGNAVDGDSIPEIDEDEDEELDPRGRPAKKNDVLIHVFIDQLSYWLSFKFCIFR